MYQPLIKPMSELRERMMKHKTSSIAKVSGVEIKTVRAIRNGLHRTPTLGTISRIGDALDSMEGVEHE